MKLDHRAEIFMNLNGAQGEISNYCKCSRHVKFCHLYIFSLHLTSHLDALNNFLVEFITLFIGCHGNLSLSDWQDQ